MCKAGVFPGREGKAALGQAAGLVLAKVGLGAAPEGARLAQLFGAEPQVEIGTILGTLVRMVAGASALVAVRPPSM